MKHLILLIEGKRVDRPQYTAGLDKKNFNVESAINGSDALTKLDDLKPNAVIIDAASMRTTGTRICASVREKLNKTPIFLILAADTKKV